MPSRDINDCTPLLQNAWCEAHEGFIKQYPNAPEPIITCTYRSPQEQEELYAKGRTKPGKIVTQLKSGSKHNKKPSEAFDIAFKKSDGGVDWSGTNFRNFAAIMKKLYPQVKWGGNFSFLDLPHFEH